MSANDPWWVVNQPTRGGGRLPIAVTHYVVVQSATRPGAAVAGPFTTQADAQNALNNLNAEGNSPASFASETGHQIASATGIGALFQASIWIRVGEVVLGLVLLAVGLARITHALPIATAVARKAGTVGLA